MRAQRGAAASLSGIVHTRLSAARSEWYRQLVRREGADPDALWGDPHRKAEVWAAHNPYDLAPGLRGTALFVSVGDGRPGPYDPPGTPVDEVEAALAAENAALVAMLRALRIPVHVDFYGPGSHRGRRIGSASCTGPGRCCERRSTFLRGARPGGDIQPFRAGPVVGELEAGGQSG